LNAQRHAAVGDVDRRGTIMNDDEDKLAQFLQQSLQNLENLKKQFRYFGPADERCPHCGNLIETLLDEDGRRPMRCCWRCETAAIERENERDQSDN
jgi:hypothetical protein